MMISYYILYLDDSLKHSYTEPKNELGIKKAWRVDLSRRENAWLFVIEALASGVPEARIRDLMTKWHITPEEAPHFTKATGLKIKFKNGLPRIKN